MHNKEIEGKASNSGPQVQKAARRKRQPERRSKKLQAVECQEPWGQIPALPLTSVVTLRRSHF